MPRVRLPHKQKNYDWMADIRDQYGLATHELREDTIMSLQGPTPPLVEQIYNSTNCGFRPVMAYQVTGLLMSRSLEKMRASNHCSPYPCGMLLE